MLALFFVLVSVCAGCFSIGFSLGRRTSMTTFNNPQAAGGSGNQRPPAGKDSTQKPATQPGDFSFYKSVGSSSPNAELAPADSQAQPSQSQSHAPSNAATGATDTSAPTPPVTNAASPVAGGYSVQVAAVSRQEDAEALVDALKRKQYPAFAANNSSTDKYYHIQVGPYADVKDAEAMRARLIADGYNPIVKK
jgi:DedD protein